MLFDRADYDRLMYQQCRPRSGVPAQEAIVLAVSEAIENYLETIYILSRQQSEVHAIDICSYLSYSRPTVSIVLRQMREHGLVTVNEDNHIYLTDDGLRIAGRIFERHEVLAQALMYLGVDRETAQRDACKIEHDLSDETFEAIKRHMGAQGGALTGAHAEAD